MGRPSVVTHECAVQPIRCLLFDCRSRVSRDGRSRYLNFQIRVRESRHSVDQAMCMTGKHAGADREASITMESDRAFQSPRLLCFR
ncbi:MAG: hypothetical protein CMJ80_00970 [Planctomycetaceae bacterium]|nr:hypothetical protein [Planctomycetaceae bacterium]